MPDSMAFRVRGRFSKAPVMAGDCRQKQKTPHCGASQDRLQTCKPVGRVYFDFLVWSFELVSWAIFRWSWRVGRVDCAHAFTSESLPLLASFWNSATSFLWSVTMWLM